MSRWQHIADAPKDGTRFICVDGEGLITVGWWEIVQPEGYGYEELMRKFLAAGKVWHEKAEWDAFVAEETGKPSVGFWTSDLTDDEGVPEEADLRYWMPLPELPDIL